MSQDKSVITCDLEGRIETFSPGAEAIFGYAADEVVGKRRVSLFSPGLVVLEHVPRWLKEASEKGECRARTAFVRKDGSRFAAEIRITPTRRGGEQIGYCGVTTPLLDVDPATVTPPASLATRLVRWLVITRAPFLSATIVPLLVGAAWAHRTGPLPLGLLGLALLGAIALHVAANVFNDYYDWRSGTDLANNDYLLPYSGGSRSIELGLIRERDLRTLGMAALIVAGAAGVALALARGPWLIAFGAAGAFLGYFYTAPPLRLVARGLGELAVALSFGPLMTAGAVFALRGVVDPWDFLVGVPVGLLTAAILLINEFPDAASDASTGKRHLVVRLGKPAARWVYLAVVAAAFAFVAWSVASRHLPPGALATLAALPLAWSASRTLLRHYADRALVRANQRTIQLQAAAGLLLALGLLWA